MTHPTTPKPAPQPRTSATRKRRKFRPADRFRSVTCAPMGTDKLIEQRRIRAQVVEPSMPVRRPFQEAD